MRDDQHGFTIIEVVLVLAVAGLIFLIVFVALPQLQRARRDTQRKSHLGQVAGAIESFASNNRGLYPTTSAGTFDDFVDGVEANFISPSTGLPYDYHYRSVSGAWTANTSPDEIYMDGSNARCRDPGEVPIGSEYNPFEYFDEDQQDHRSLASFAVVIGLETGGWYCLDNSGPQLP